MDKAKMKLKTSETQLNENTLDSDSESFMSFLVISGLEHCGMAMPMESDTNDYHRGPTGNITLTTKEDSTHDGIHDDVYDGGTSKCSTLSATSPARRVRNAKASHLVSILLFVMGSVLYLVLAVWDYQWARSVQGWPEDILVNYEDEITYNNYRLKLLYYGSEAAVEEAEDAGGLRRILFGGWEGWEFESSWEHFSVTKPPSESTATIEVDTEVEAIADGVDETSGKTESIEAPITIDLDVRIDPAPSIFTDNDIPPGVNVTSNETEVVETPTTIDPEAGVALAQGIAAYFDELYGIVDGVNETSGETEVIEAATTIDPEADTLNVIPDGVDVTPEETEVVGAPTTIDPAAEVSAALTPEIVAYYDEYWKDLPLEIQDAFGVLGYNETAWNGGVEPESSGLYWDEVTPEQQEAALFIGYTSEMWDTEVDALAYPTASPVPFDATKVVEAGYYDVFSWDEMPPEVQDAFATLGYNKDLWDDPLGIGLKASSDESDWADLTPEQQQAAALVGYYQQSWDAPPTDSDVYDVLDDDTLIYTKSGWWIGRYTTIYFSASLCFLVSGFVDFFREKHFFHIFMALGGVTGCISAIYMYNSDLLSSIFDVTSAHIFLLEAIKMFFEEESLAEDAAKWMKRFLMLADLEFLLGAIGDVCMSYVWWFDDSADWSMLIVNFSIVNSVLWFHCSLIYLVAFFYFPQKGYDPTKHRKWTWL